MEEIVWKWSFESEVAAAYGMTEIKPPGVQKLARRDWIKLAVKRGFPIHLIPGNRASK